MELATVCVLLLFLGIVVESNPTGESPQPIKEQQETLHNVMSKENTHHDAQKHVKKQLQPQDHQEYLASVNQQHDSTNQDEKEDQVEHQVEKGQQGKQEENRRQNEKQLPADIHAQRENQDKEGKQQLEDKQVKDKDQHRNKISESSSAQKETDDKEQKQQGQETSATSDGNEDDLDVEKLFSFKDTDIWSEQYLKSRISIRLVKKSWQAWGPANKTDEILEEFKWDTTKAAHLATCLRETPPYQYLEQPLDKAEALFAEEAFNKGLPNIVIIHPVSHNPDGVFVRTTITALAMRNLHRSHNLFAVDLSRLEFNMFTSVLLTYFGENPMIYPMAKAVGGFFLKAVEQGYMSPDQIHLIGWSYSGQLVGYIGRHIKVKTSLPVGTIVALDPIGSPNNEFIRPITRSDGHIVHVYHTNSYPIGTLARDGTADFVFNGGLMQPECRRNESPMFCSHDNVIRRLWYVILYGANIFQARQCASLVRYNFGMCNSNPTAKLTYPITDRSANGKYFLGTAATAPYGVGVKGSVSNPNTRKLMEESIKEHRDTGVSKSDLMMFIMMLLN